MKTETNRILDSALSAEITARHHAMLALRAGGFVDARRIMEDSSAQQAGLARELRDLDARLG